MFDWIKDHGTLVAALGAASVLVLIASVILAPALVVRIPADYFTHARRPSGWLARQRPALQLLLRLGKNVLGGVLLLAGIAMLALPGQGLLTMLLGFFLLDGPGKYRFEKWLVRRRWVHRSINWLRVRRGRELLQVTASK